MSTNGIEVISEADNKFFVSAHSVAFLNIEEGAIGASLPFLFLDDGELSIPALAWARSRMRDETLSSVTLEKDIEAVGHLYDYYVWRYRGEVLTVKEFRLLIKYFHEDRRYGIPALGWPPVTPDTAKYDERAVKNFSRWCAENYGFIDINPDEVKCDSELTAKERHTKTAREEYRKNWDLLYHIRSTGNPTGCLKERQFNTADRKSKSRKHGYKNFPPDKVWRFINNATCARDKLYYLLMFFGGTRISEPLHLFATDVSLTVDGSAKVILAHPQFGSYSWQGIDQRKKHGTRAAFLAERYGLGPRNLLARKHPMRAGWKGMAFDNGQRQETEIIWIDERAGHEFAKAHIEYMSTVRSKVPDTHPYYFVNQEGASDLYGAPLKRSNINKSFYRTTKRIGLVPGQPGTSPHSSRHFTGWYGANILKIPLEYMQKILRHEQIESTEVYYKLTQETVKKELKQGLERIAAANSVINLLGIEK